MMNGAVIQYVDVSQCYFDVFDFDYSRYTYIFDDEKGLQVSMNHVISKVNAIKKAHQVFQMEQNEFTELYVSADAMKVGLIKDYLGNKIFGHLSEELSGWVFLFDPIPFANWEHPCQYLLVVNEECYERVDYQRGAADTVRLDKIC